MEVEILHDGVGAKLCAPLQVGLEHVGGPAQVVLSGPQKAPEVVFIELRPQRPYLGLDHAPKLNQLQLLREATGGEGLLY